MTLMHNTSGVTDDFFGVQVNWRPWPSRLLTTLNQVLRAFVAERTQTTPLEMSPLLLGLKSFPVAPPWGGPLDLGSEMGPFLFSITFILIFPDIVTMLVEEKQARIRIMMRMMGLGTSAYWSITFAFWFLVYIVFALVFMMLVNLVALPSGYKIGMFANVLPGVQFIFFMLYATVTISFAFLWANLTTRLRTAQVSTILWVVMTTVLPFILDSIGQIFTSTGFPQGFLTFLSLFPPFALFRGLTFFRAFKDRWNNPYSDNTFLDWNEVPPDSPLAEVLIIWTLEAPVLFLLTLYLDQVMSTGYGVPRHPLFFLGYTSAPEKTLDFDAEAPNDEPGKAPDVLEEEMRVRALEGGSRSKADNDAVHVLDPRKTYPGPPAKHAVRGLTMGIKRGECFGMLGPNGAGKTTAINMLIGLDTPTGGNAMLEGFSILNSMEKIYSIMGVCPQHDLLWPTLTAREHLAFYGSLKNLKGRALARATTAGLKAVRLLDVIDSRVATFSGGMKRRLSVAISLIGQPLVCFLDEPSTGLDPSSRRLLWRCILQAKTGRAILLTTHSMEEAEGLCDRLGVFVDGRLRCIGEPSSLTRRYGGMFLLKIAGAAGKDAQVHKLVAKLSPHYRNTYSLAGTFTFELPARDTKLSQVFADMIAARKAQVLTSWGISSCTLEDAFIKIAQQGAENAQLPPSPVTTVTNERTRERTREEDIQVDVDKKCGSPGDH